MLSKDDHRKYTQSVILFNSPIVVHIRLLIATWNWERNELAPNLIVRSLLLRTNWSNNTSSVSYGRPPCQSSWSTHYIAVRFTRRPLLLLAAVLTVVGWWLIRMVTCCIAWVLRLITRPAYTVCMPHVHAPGNRWPTEVSDSPARPPVRI